MFGFILCAKIRRILENNSILEEKVKNILKNLGRRKFPDPSHIMSAITGSPKLFLSKFGTFGNIVVMGTWVENCHENRHPYPGACLLPLHPGIRVGSSVKVV